MSAESWYMGTKGFILLCRGEPTTSLNAVQWCSEAATSSPLHKKGTTNTHLALQRTEITIVSRSHQDERILTSFQTSFHLQTGQTKIPFHITQAEIQILLFKNTLVGVGMGIENRFLVRTGSVCSNSMAPLGSSLNGSLNGSRQHQSLALGSMTYVTFST